MKRNTWEYCGAIAIAVLFFSAFSMADSTETHYYSGSMLPANEVPAITDVTASAQATITAVVRRDGNGNIISGTVYFDVDYNFAQAVTVDGLHIHQGSAGVNGPIRIDTGISDAASIAASGAGNVFRPVQVTGGAALTALIGLVADPSGFYVNIHTTANPGGVMRDQLKNAARPAPAVSDSAVVNNASFASGSNPLAAGSIAAIFGKYLNDGPDAVFPSAGADGKLNTSLGGTQVKVNGITAPIFYSTFGQVGIQIPEELAGQTSATVLVTSGGQTSVSRNITLDTAAPGIFTLNQAGTGPAAMLHQDGVTAVTAANPARPDETVILFGTGFGTTNPALGTGVFSSGNRVVNSPTVTVDGVQVVPDFAGRAPGFVGLDQVNVKLPSGTRSGSDISIRMTSGARQSNSVTTSVSSGTPPASNPVPVIGSLSPGTAYIGDQAFVMTITGNGFTPSSTVFLDNVQRPSVYMSDTQLTVGITSTDCSSQHTFTVQVSNPAPGGGSSNAAVFFVTPEPPPPPPGYDY